jgi:sugar O-acyltransferase (sialic acid O-acetyltransferase NeuD family)
MENRQKLIILGSRIFSEEVADLVSECADLELVAFGENWERERCNDTLLGYPIIWIDDLAPFAPTHRAVCGIGTTHRSLFVGQARDLGFEFAVVRHPSARVSATSTVGKGSILSVGVIVGAHTTIGEHVIINRGSLIGHHTRIGDFVTVSPGANIAGAIEIGEGTYIGMGAIVLDHIKIGSHSVVGAGAVVTKDVPDNVQVLGVPAQITKTNIDGR